MKILAIETSCDETGAAVVEQNKTSIKLLSNVVPTSLGLHAKTGGIIPEIAAREQVKYILPVIQKALSDATIQAPDLDGLAVTYGPGLIGSLLVGVETAKTLSLLWNKPLIPINHLFGHIYANFIHQEKELPTAQDLPAIALLISGGHTDLVYMKDLHTLQWIGGTRDDAAGEAFDKIGRMLGIAYPAGPYIEVCAKQGTPKAFHLPRPLMYDNSLDFSFSGLKTAVLREIEKEKNLSEEFTNNICRAAQDAIIEVLIAKTIQAVQKYNTPTVLLGGGVAANQTLIQSFQEKIAKECVGIKLFAPLPKLCTDNAAMIGAAACMSFKPQKIEDITADPELYFD